MGNIIDDDILKLLMVGLLIYLVVSDYASYARINARINARIEPYEDDNMYLHFKYINPESPFDELEIDPSYDHFNKPVEGLEGANDEKIKLEKVSE